jgi:hypothetical protein
MSTDNLNRVALVVGICQYDTLSMSEELTKLSEDMIDDNNNATLVEDV